MDTSKKTTTYLQRIQAAVPDIKIEQFEVNNEGLVNDVLIINRTRIFRFPKSEWAIKVLHHEASCLELARNFVEIPLPRWEIHEKDFVSYNLVPGVALQRYEILRQDESAQDALARQIGTFLHQLHTIPPDIVEQHGIGLSDTVRTTENWVELYEQVQQKLFPLLMPVAREWVHNLFAPLLAGTSWMDYMPTFINGDLAAYHLLYNPDTRLLSGIIDFGTAGIGDPACDFGCLIDQYGEGFVRRIGRFYPMTTDLIERARFWAGTLELQWALGGLRHPEDPSWFFVHIGRARDVQPIGSGW